ncbi:MAG: DUF3553 domain-containing protein [Deltaproteobacteria bacterium]|nr:DUF3553 domain-containing protein [Deltaproteobacteria bacterium]
MKGSIQVLQKEIDYKKLLNSAQFDAVTTLEGPVLVIAGAGSGKTRALVYRVARLVESGIPPESVLLLTFTRKAAQEMLERAAGLSDARCRFVSGGTFHSLAHRVLRSHAELLDYSNSFTILDRSDMEEAIHSLVPGPRLPKGIHKFPKRSTLADIISKSANLERPVEDLMEEEYAQFIEFIPQIKSLETGYRNYKQANHLMDYDDLIINLRKLLIDYPDVRTQLSLRYRYIMVDEYQDTNSIQSDIVRWLAHEHRNIMVVGDDSQSIYSFRGANYRNMFEFPVHFPETRIIRLEENYRSTQPILRLANALMDKASEKFTKCLFTNRIGGEQPKVMDTMTGPGQAQFISRYIINQLHHGHSITDFAVLFRSGYHSFELEAELNRQGIKYTKYGGFKFLESAHIKDFLAHLRVMVNKDETVSWQRVLGLIKNIGPARTASIIKWMREDSIGPADIEKWPGSGRNADMLKPLSLLFTKLASLHGTDPEKAVEQVMEYYSTILEDKFDDYPRRKKELDQLLPMARRYKRLGDFIDDLVLEPPNSSNELSQGDKTELLTLSTIHSAKGLEWPTVFIIWATEGRLPPSRAYQNPSVLEEERRLLYVAATRAKDHLIVSYPGQETMPLWQFNNRSENGSQSRLSSFLNSLPEGVVSYGSIGNGEKRPVRSWQREDSGRKNTNYEKYNASCVPLDNTVSQDLSTGDRVNHPAFGAGVVSRFISGDKIEILFKNAGRKLLHLEYTKLEKII